MKRILAVDDSASIRLLVAAVLAAEGFEVVTASDGVSALAQMHARRPDAIFLDLVMPGMDGWAFLEAVRGERDLAQARIALLSSHSDVKEIAGELRVDAWLPKPFAIGQLVETAQRLLFEPTAHVSQVAPPYA